jgi:hypothetical protein
MREIITFTVTRYNPGMSTVKSEDEFDHLFLEINGKWHYNGVLTWKEIRSLGFSGNNDKWGWHYNEGAP